MVDRTTLPAELEATAGDRRGGIVMGLCHRMLPIAGVQFIPSIASEHGHKLIANFLQDCGMNLDPAKLAAPPVTPVKIAAGAAE